MNTNLITKHIKWDKYYKLTKTTPPMSGEWLFISARENLSEDFIREFAKYLNWKLISSNDFSSEFIEEFKEKIWFAEYLNAHCEKVDENFLRKYSEYFDDDAFCWLRISKIPNLSQEFINDFQGKLNMRIVNNKKFSLKNN